MTLYFLFLWFHYLLDSKQSHNVAVVKFPEHLKLSHLDIMGSAVAQYIENFHSHQLARSLHKHAHSSVIDSMNASQTSQKSVMLPTSLKPQTFLIFEAATAKV